MNIQISHFAQILWKNIAFCLNFLNFSLKFRFVCASFIDFNLIIITKTIAEWIFILHFGWIRMFISFRKKVELNLPKDSSTTQGQTILGCIIVVMLKRDEWTNSLKIDAIFQILENMNINSEKPYYIQSVWYRIFRLRHTLIYHQYTKDIHYPSAGIRALFVPITNL